MPYRVNVKAWYNEQQIFKVWDCYVQSKGLKYFIDQNRQQATLFSAGNTMSIVQHAGLIINSDGTLYVNQKGQSVSICTRVDYLDNFVEGYSGITSDLEESLKQVERYNSISGIRDHVIAFAYRITVAHFSLGVLELNFDEAKMLTQARIKIYNPLPECGGVEVSERVKYFIDELIKRIFIGKTTITTEIWLQSTVVANVIKQQNDGDSCGVISAENGKDIIDGAEDRLRTIYLAGASDLRARHLDEVKSERFEAIQYRNEVWQDPKFIPPNYIVEVVKAFQEIIQDSSVSIGIEIKNALAIKESIERAVKIKEIILNNQDIFKNTKLQITEDKVAKKTNLYDLLLKHGTTNPTEVILQDQTVDILAAVARAIKMDLDDASYVDVAIDNFGTTKAFSIADLDKIYAKILWLRRDDYAYEIEDVEHIVNGLLSKKLLKHKIIPVKAEDAKQVENEVITLVKESIVGLFEQVASNDKYDRHRVSVAIFIRTKVDQDIDQWSCLLVSNIHNQIKLLHYNPSGEVLSSLSPIIPKAIAEFCNNKQITLSIIDFGVKEQTNSHESGRLVLGRISELLSIINRQVVTREDKLGSTVEQIKEQTDQELQALITRTQLTQGVEITSISSLYLLYRLDHIEVYYADLIRGLVHESVFEEEKIGNRLDHLTKVFQGLAELYIEKAKISHNPEHYTEAAKFYQYVISINNKAIEVYEKKDLGTEGRDVEIERHRRAIEESGRQLDEIGKELVDLVVATPTIRRNALYDGISDKLRLERLREYSKIHLSKIDMYLENVKRYLSEQKRASDAVFIESSKELFVNIAEEMKTFLANLYSDAEAIIGKPPCGYAVIGLGSMALQQITPYSDLEFAILTEHNSDPQHGGNPEIQKYFLRLTHLVHFRVINLGETPIPKSKYSINLDRFIKRGVNFDLGGKTPLGRIDKDKPYLLIQTIEAMMRYVRNENSATEHIDALLPYELEVCTHVHGNVQLTIDYQVLIDGFMEERTLCGLKQCQFRSLKMLKEGAAEIDYSSPERSLTQLRGTLENFTPELLNRDGKLFNVKGEIYRLPDRMIYGLALYYGIRSSVWDSVNKLRVKNIINEIAEHHLKQAICFATLLRIEVYNYYNAQRDEVSIPSPLIKDGVFYFKDKDCMDSDSALFRFYYSIIPLHRELNRFYYVMLLKTSFFNDLRKKGSVHGDLIEDETFWREQSFYDDSKSIQSSILIRLLRFKEASKIYDKRNSAGAKGSILLEDDDNRPKIDTTIFDRFIQLAAVYRSNDYQKAVDLALSELEIFKQDNSLSGKSSLVELLNLIGLCYHYLGNLHKSKDFFIQALEISKSIGKDSFNTIHNIGLVYSQLSEYEEALKFFTDSFGLNKKESNEDTLFAATTLNCMGVALYGLRRYSEALGMYFESLAIRKRILSPCHPNIVTTTNNIANIYCDIGEYEKGLSFYLDALDFYKQFSINANVKREIATCLFNIGRVLCDLEKYDEALSRLTEALEMRKELFPAHHPGIIRCLSAIVNTYTLLRQFDRALEYQNIMDIALSQISDYSQHINVLNDKASIYLQKGDIEKSIDVLKEMLILQERKISINADEILATNFKIGMAYHFASKNDKALPYLIKTVDKLNAFSLDTPNDYIKHMTLTYGTKFGRKVAFSKAKLLHLNVQDVSFFIDHLLQLNKIVVDILLEQRKYVLAIIYLKKSVYLAQKSSPVDYDLLLKLFNNLGNTYGQKMKDHKTALQIYGEELAIRKEHHADDKEGHAACLQNIGYSYGEMADRNPLLLSLSLYHHRLALDMLTSILPLNDIRIGDSYNNCLIIAYGLNLSSQVFGFTIVTHNQLLQYAERAIKVWSQIPSIGGMKCDIVFHVLDKIYNKFNTYTIENLCSFFEIVIISSRTFPQFKNRSEQYFTHCLRSYGNQNNILNIENLRHSFLRAVEYGSTKDNAGLYTEYANFLLGRQNYKEAFYYLQQAIDSNDSESKLSYGKVEKENVPSLLRNVIDSVGTKEIEVVAIHYAYYLMILHYERFVAEGVEGLEARDTYIALFESLDQVDHSISHTMLEDAKRITKDSEGNKVLVVTQRVRNDVVINEAVRIKYEEYEKIHPELVSFQDKIEKLEENLAIAISLGIGEEQKKLFDLLEKQYAGMLEVLQTKDLVKVKQVENVDKKANLVKVLENLALIYELRSQALIEELRALQAEPGEDRHKIEKQYGEAVTTANLYYNTALTVNKSEKEEDKEASTRIIIQLQQLERNYVEIVSVIGATKVVSRWTEREESEYKVQVEELREKIKLKLETIDKEFKEKLGKLHKPERSVDKRIAQLKAKQGLEEVSIDPVVLLNPLTDGERIQRSRENEEYAKYKEVENEVYYQRAEKIWELSKFITESLKNYLSTLIGGCEEEIGIAPCNYAVIALGSLAKGTATPYSDLEFLIVIDDKGSVAERKNYFRSLAYLIKQKIQNLGESLIATDRYDINLDELVKTGIQFDLGGRTPLGRIFQDGRSFELIKTISELVECLEDEYFKIDKFLPFELLTFSFVYGGKSGEGISLYKGYKDAVGKFLSKPSLDGETMEARRTKQIVYEGYKYGKNLENVQKSNAQEFEPDTSLAGKLYNVKQEVYRLPDRLLEGLCKDLEAKGETIWEQLEDLRVRGMLNEAGVKHLKVLVSISNRLRLRTYIDNEGQKEILSANINVNALTLEEVSRVFNLEIIDELFEFYYVAIPLHESMVSVNEFQTRITTIGNERTASEFKRKFFQAFSFYNDSLFRQGIIYYRIMRYEESIICHTEVLKEEPSHYGALNNIGTALDRLGRYKEALQWRQKILTKYTSERPYTLNPQAEVADLLHNEGNTLECLGRHREALDAHSKALEIYRRVYGNNPHASIARSLYHIGTALQKLGHYKEAFDTHKKALEMKRDKAIYGNKPYVDVAHSLDAIGCTLHSLKRNEEALQHHKEALTIYRSEAVYGAKSHAEVAGSFTNMANVLFSLGKSKETLESYKEALAIYRDKTVYGNKPHAEVAALLSNIGNALGSLKKYAEALKYFIEAYKMINHFDGHPYTKSISYYLFDMSILFSKEHDLNVDITVNLIQHFSKQDIEISDYKHHCIRASLAYSEGDVYLTILYYKLALIFLELEIETQETIETKISINHSLGRAYNALALQWQNNEIIKESKVNVEKAQEAFQKAMAYSMSKENKIALYTEYANFLLQQDLYVESFYYLQQAINSGDSESKLSYGEVEKDIVSPLLQQAIDAAGDKQIKVIALHYAYYLLLLNYDKFVEAKVEGLEVKEVYSTVFDRFVFATEDSIFTSYLMLADVSRIMGDEARSSELLALAKPKLPDEKQISLPEVTTADGKVSSTQMRDAQESMRGASLAVEKRSGVQSVASVQVAQRSVMTEEDAKKESLAMAQGKSAVGPRNIHIPEFDLQDVEGDGNCFFRAVADQIHRLNLSFLRDKPVTTEDHVFLRGRVQGASFSDTVWTDEQEYNNLVRTFPVVLAIIDTRNPDRGFNSVRYFDRIQNEIINVVNPGELPGDLHIIRLAATGNHFLSVHSHPELNEGAIHAAWSLRHQAAVSDHDEFAGVVVERNLRGMDRSTVETTAAILDLSLVRELPLTMDGYKTIIVDSDYGHMYPSNVEVIYTNTQGTTASCADNALLTALKARELGLDVYLYEISSHLVVIVQYPIDQYRSSDELLNSINRVDTSSKAIIWNSYKEFFVGRKVQCNVLYLGNSVEAIYQSFNRLLEGIKEESMDIITIISATEKLINKIITREEGTEQFEEMLSLLLDIQSNTQKHKAEYDSLITSYEDTNSLISEGIKTLSNLASSSSIIVQSYINDLIEKLRDIVPKTILEECNIIQALERLVEFQSSYTPILPIGRPPHGPNDDDPDDWGRSGGDNPYVPSDDAILLSGNMTNNYNSTSIDWSSNIH